MTKQCRKRAGRLKWGVLGGMGPYASAEFLKTIYRTAGCDLEQDAPVVMVYSDPGFPDRTAALLSGRRQMLADRLEESLGILSSMGADRIVICCTTIHAVLPDV